MKNTFFKKGLIVGIIILFIGVTVDSSISSVKNHTKIENSSYKKTSFNPFNQGWKYRKQITIDHTKVVGTLMNFPVLVSTIDSDLASKAQADGDDILFMTDIGEAEQLFHEIESFDNSTGELVAWVNVPYLSLTDDTVFFMYYGNPDCSSLEFPESVWDSNYCGVWHLNGFQDSTINENDGINHGTDGCSGKIGYAKNFVEINNDYIDLGDMQEPANNKITTATFEIWVNPDDIDVAKYLISKANTGEYEPDKLCYGFYINDERKIGFALYSGTWYPQGNKIYFKTNESHIVVGSWQHVSITINLLDKNANIYYNGEEKDNTRTIVGNPPSYFYDINYPEEFGRLVWESATRRYNGVMDEVRISKICRSSEWILTEYNNQNDPSSFLSFRDEETGLKSTFVIGSFEDLNTVGDSMIIDALNIRCIQRSPFAFVPYASGEKLIISKDGYVGLLIFLPTTKFIIAICNMDAL